MYVFVNIHYIQIYIHAVFGKKKYIRLWIDRMDFLNKVGLFRLEAGGGGRRMTSTCALGYGPDIHTIYFMLSADTQISVYVCGMYSL